MLALPGSDHPLPDEAEDTAVPGVLVNRLDGPLRLPALIFGAGVFSNQYNADDLLASETPVRVIRLALRYGLCAIDTSVYYGPSELVVGNALKLLEEEFPRSSYQLMTKCGRYGPTTFDYSPARIRDSVERSLQRLQTTYLDTIYLHDVEFVGTPFGPISASGHHAAALHDKQKEYGLAEGDEGVVRGEGDEKILAAFRELRKMKDEGLVRNIGITGYPLPTLLRLALLILNNAPFKPVDIILNYSHSSLQNATFHEFTRHFRERAKVTELIAASPYSMGLLVSSIKPLTNVWHPAPTGLRAAVAQAAQEFQASGSELSDVALGYSIGKAEADGVPVAVGCSTLSEVHETVRVWRDVKAGARGEETRKIEDRAQEIIREAGFLNWSWPSP